MSAVSNEKERAFLVAVKPPGQGEIETRELLQELEELTKTCDTDIIGSRIIKIDKSQSRYLIGSGNAADINNQCRDNKIDLIIFDNDLTPSQQRNWEKLTGIRVIDRREIILDIFASRASTKEAVLQIELAKSEYILPRLKRAWTHLSRQKGGVGLKGEGEKQIEVDERLVRRRISKLKQDLKLVRKQRAEQRKKRQKKPVPNIAIVGYTNAGKSSFLNCLTQSDILIEDKLFATLDPTTRKLVLGNNQVVLLTDTVGFVRNLPHDLIEAFKATLEEAVLATFLIQIVDITSSNYEDHIKTTHDVLQKIGAEDNHIITVFNKIDLVKEPYLSRRIKRSYPDAIFISTKTKEGVPELLKIIEHIIDEDLNIIKLRIPQDKYDIVALLHRTGHITNEQFEDEAIYITASVPNHFKREFEQFVV